jgi:hypothetical protein
MSTASRGPARHSGHRTVATSAAAALATLGIAATCAADYMVGARTAPAKPAAAAKPAPPAAPGPAKRLADLGENWPRSFFDSLFGIPHRAEPRPPPSTYRRPPPREGRRPAPVTRASPQPSAARRSENGTTYRTVCVRLCDGYYWPISFATGRDAFDRDSKTCKKSCESPAALYYYPNPGGEPEDMVGLDGKPYKSLDTAFVYRANYDASCKCRPHPWEAEAAERHRRYAAPPKRTRAAGR